MDDENFMKIALNLAQEALNAQEVPVGCLFVIGSDIIAKGRNTVNETRNPTRHAELNCVDETIQYCSKNGLNTQDVFRNITVVVTVEPCIMCADTLHRMQVYKVVYGCANDRFGGKTVLDVSDFHQKPYLQTSGVMAESAMALLKDFYKGTNPMAPQPKIKLKHSIK